MSIKQKTENTLFYDQYGNTWIALENDEANLMQIGSEEFGYWLGVSLAQKANISLNSHQLRAISVRLKNAALRNGIGEKRLRVNFDNSNSSESSKSYGTKNSVYELQYIMATHKIFMNGVYIAKYRSGSINDDVFSFLYSTDYKSGDTVNFSAITTRVRKMPQFKSSCKLDPAVFEAFLGSMEKILNFSQL